MRRLIAILGSLGIGIMLTAAGLIIDARTLIYSGVAVFAAMAALALWEWGRATPAPALTPLTFKSELPPANLSDEEKALFSLKRARDAAEAAYSKGSSERAKIAYNDLQAALLTIKKRYGFGPLNLIGKGGTVPYLSLMVCYVQYVDRFYYFLREGHVEEAKAQAMAFKWGWDEYGASMRAARD